jgi:hypothetical protein
MTDHLPLPHGDPDHPILGRPWEYEIVGLCYHRDLESPAESYIDLTLQNGDRLRRLRFFGPRDLQIRGGFPSSSGLCIVDVSGGDARVSASASTASRTVVAARPSGPGELSIWTLATAPDRAPGRVSYPA